MGVPGGFLIMKRVAFGVSIMALGGCSLVNDAPKPQAEAHPLCASFASQRVQDAAINGYEGDVLKQIYAQSYQSCADIAKKTDIVRSGN